MIEEPSDINYLDALRNDLPTAADEARLRRRLSAVGLGVAVTAVTHSSAAAAASIKPVSLLSTLSHTFASLPVLSQVSLVAATTAIIATGPVVVVTNAVQTRTAPTAVATIAATHASTRDRVATPHAPLLIPPAQERPAPPTGATNSSLTALTAPTSSSPSRAESSALDDARSSLVEETALVDAAFFAIRAKRFEEAARLLHTHKIRFPHGTLSLERERAMQKLREAEGSPIP